MRLYELTFHGKEVELKYPLRVRSGKNITTLEPSTKVKIQYVSDKQDLVKFSTEDGENLVTNSNDFFNALYHGENDESA